MLAPISKTDAEWLLNVYAPKRGYRVDNGSVGMFLKAYNLMRGGEKKINCFSCEGRAIAKIASNMFEQYEAEIQAIAKPKRGRKKKNGEK